MTDHVGEFDNRHASLELLDDKGVAEIIHLGSGNASNTEVAVDGGTDVANQEGIASLGDKEGGVFGFGATSHIFFDG